jgi:hypothetical protein
VCDGMCCIIVRALSSCLLSVGYAPCGHHDGAHVLHLVINCMSPATCCTMQAARPAQPLAVRWTWGIHSWQPGYHHRPADETDTSSSCVLRSFEVSAALITSLWYAHGAA